jgi:hypothetical protein
MMRRPLVGCRRRGLLVIAQANVESSPATQ